MNSPVTRGRGEMVVTATGMATEVGRISGMLSAVRGEDAADTPARSADDRVSRSWRGRRSRWSSSRPYRTATLRRAVSDRDQPGGRGDPDRAARGRHDDAVVGDAGARRQGRDRQAAALGRDARLDVGDLLGQDRHADPQPDDRAPARRRRPALPVEGEGYSTEGRILRVAGERTRRSSRSCCRWRSRTTRPCATARSSATRPRPRSSSSPRRAGSTSTRRGAVFPRVAEVPFDSDYKLMATFHEMEDDGRKVVRCFVKGAPDVLLARSSPIRDADGSAVPAGGGRERVLGRERPPRGRGAARARRRLARHRSRRLRPRRRPARRGAGPDAARAGRHRRPAAQGGEGRDRPLQGGRDPRPHDHRRPRHDRGRDRAPSSASRAGR